MSETTALAVRHNAVASLQDVEKVGKWMAESGMFGCKNAPQAMVLALTCQMENITPIEFGRKYHLIDGKPAMRTDAMLATFHALGGTEKWVRADDTMAVAKWSYKSNTDFEVRFSMDDAKRAGIVRPGSGWTKYPDAMLRARCIAKAIRMLCPEAITGGGYTAEEMEDMRDMPASAPGGMVAVQVEAPKTIAPEDVTVSAPVTAGPAGIEEPPEVKSDGATDYEIIPIGQRKGEKFTDQTAKYLATFVAKAEGKEGVEAGHIERAKAVLAEKEGAK